MAPTSTTQLAFKVLGDVAIILTIGISSILIRQLATPFQRGFFRDDQSIMLPYKEGTIPASVLYGVGFTLPALAIIVTEGAWILLKSRKDGTVTPVSRGQVGQWLLASYRAILVFFFGAAVTHFSTNVPKYTIGRLRPHFLSVCQPDWTLTNSTGYIEDDICTGSDKDRITEARVSFPSGHSSMAVYCMAFLAIYMQERWVWRGLDLLRPFLQMMCLLMGFYTCLSRVSDYKHHWSDVLAGGILGLVIAILVFWGVWKSGSTSPVTVRVDADQGLLVQAPTATNGNSNASATAINPQSTAL